MTHWPLNVNSRLCFSELRYRNAGKGNRIRAGRAYISDVAAELRAELSGKRIVAARRKGETLFAGAAI